MRQTNQAAGPDDNVGLKALDPNSFGTFLGLAVWLMSMSKEHRHLPISSIEKRILPAVLLKQFKLFKKGKMPIAFLTWASVSDSVKTAFEASGELPDLALWRSGTNVIVVDCVSPFGPTAPLRKDFLNKIRPPTQPGSNKGE